MMTDRVETQATSFNAIRISIASPDQIKSWSHGEVTKPETINYRTLRPEKDGLFCERIFGPTKDWECFCGKYKRIRYRGVVCDRCGVEVTRSKVRRERMGHINLASPVAHIWFSKGTPSRLGLLLDLSPRNLERVLYFAQHIVVFVDDDARSLAIEDKQRTYDLESEKRNQALEVQVTEVESKFQEATADSSEEESQAERVAIDVEIADMRQKVNEELNKLRDEMEARVDELEDLRVGKLIAESRYRELREHTGHVFRAMMGAEGIMEILKLTDLEALREHLLQEMRSTSGQRRKKAIKRLRVVEAFRKSGNKPEWMIMTVLPVLPPDLRPMVQLDGGRFATSDLNDLYRRVINRNNRLRRLLDLGAPEIIVRNEKRMLQEAVDALIDNGRRGRPIQGSHNHKLKSLSDLLRGKQGRFRQNLLGKRVDYSGRSVIVVGAELALHQCGLPKRMALELFKPFVMHRLVVLGISPNIKSAKRMVERARPEVWDILEDVIKERPVLLNRAPTLHRLGIQAFMPVLIEGSAIQIHPLVCSAFNADFDGDQMAVHVPLSAMAVAEAKETMLSVHNMLSPASGEPLVAPTLDMVLGCYYLTDEAPAAVGAGKVFVDYEEARMAFEAEQLDLRAPIRIRDAEADGGWRDTTLGRMIFNEVLPPEIEFKNQLMDKGALKDLTAECYRQLGNQEAAKVLDSVKSLGFHYATTSGLTIAINDIQVSPKKGDIIRHANQQVEVYEDQYMQGLVTEEERYSRTVDTWTKAADEMEEIVKEDLSNYGGVALMAVSGAKGNIAQIKQMAGMRGLMSDPKGRIIDLPIKSSFREGLTALEYFISTHGARKGLADTALRTADSGYLTRRLIDVSQEVIILEEDCETTDGILLQSRNHDPLLSPLEESLLGRIAAGPIANPNTGEIIVESNEEITEELISQMMEAGMTEAYVRSPLACDARRGICQECYGRIPATGKVVDVNSAVGIIAAQSIGEPGTQLTMRTFHTGGVAGLDITSGLPRVEELFEARIPKGYAVLSDIDGIVAIQSDAEGRRIKVISTEEYREDYSLAEGYELLVGAGEFVDAGASLARSLPAPGSENGDATEAAAEILAGMSGKIELDDKTLSIVWEDIEEREYIVPASAHVLVEDGTSIKAGDALTAGPLNPHDMLRIRGKDELQRYLIGEVQKVYRSQGVTIHDKHIEVILRQMLRRVQVDTPGDAEFIPGQIVDRFEFQDKNAKVLAEGGEPATAKPVLLGVTRASLLTDSFLAAASFQETTRVLTEAATTSARDRLLGLKENVIIGRLIPARSNVKLPEIMERPNVSQLFERMESEGLPASWLERPLDGAIDGTDTNGHDSGGQNGVDAAAFLEAAMAAEEPAAE